MRKLTALLALGAILAVGCRPALAADIKDPILVGTKATFVAEADGTAPILFEWYRDGVKIGEGTPFSIDLTGPEFSGTYYATASNEFSRASGMPAVMSTDRYLVTVGSPPSAPRIKRVLENTTVRRGTDVKLEIEADGALPITYSWQHGNYMVRGANQPYVVLNDVKNKDGGYWAAFARNAYGGAMSEMTLTIRQN